MEQDLNKILLLLLIVINIPFYRGLASILFGKDGIFGAIQYLFIPELLSAMRGEFWDDKWSELMFTLWVVLCISLVWSEYNYIEANFPEIFSCFRDVD